MNDLVTVGNYIDRMSAEFAKATLASADIESYVRANDEGGMGSFLLTGSGGAGLLVRAEDEGRASELLRVAPKIRRAVKSRQRPDNALLQRHAKKH